MKSIKQEKMVKRILLLCVIMLCVGSAIGSGLAIAWKDNELAEQVKAEQERKLAEEKAAKKQAEEERLARLVDKESIPVLAYHSVQPDYIKKMYYPTNRYVISQSRFAAQMGYLSSNGYKSLTMDEFYDWYKNGTKQEPKTVVITFDDGYADASDIAEPILKKNGLIATTFVIGSTVKDTRGKSVEGKLNFISKADIHKKDSSMLYYSHTYALHSFNPDGSNKVETKTEDELKADFKQQQQIVSTEYIALPHGNPSVTYDAIAKQSNTKLMFLFGDESIKQATRKDSCYRIPRIHVNGFIEIEDFTTYLGE